LQEEGHLSHEEENAGTKGGDSTAQHGYAHLCHGLPCFVVAGMMIGVIVRMHLRISKQK
jgi:hypothetical protein